MGVFTWGAPGSELAPPLQCDKDQHVPSPPGVQASPEARSTHGIWHGRGGAASAGKVAQSRGGPERCTLHTDPKRQARGPRGRRAAQEKGRRPGHARRDPAVPRPTVPRAGPVTQDTGCPSKRAHSENTHLLALRPRAAVRQDDPRALSDEGNC